LRRFRSFIHAAVRRSSAPLALLLALNPRGQPRLALGQRSVFAPGDERVRQPIVLQAARGAARRAGKHEAAELVVEDEDVVGDFDPRRRTQAPGGFTVAVFERHWVLLQLKRAALLYAHTSHRVAGHLLSESRTFVSGSQRLRRTQRLSAGPLAWPVSCATSAHAWVMGSRWMP